MSQTALKIKESFSQPRPEVETLSSMPVFGGVCAEALEFLARGAERIRMPRGACYFREGQGGGLMYVLLQGQVAIYRGTGPERDTLVHLQAGDCFGEMALLDLHPRSATAEAVEESLALGISHTLLYDLYGHLPEAFTIVMMNLARELSRRLRAADEQLEQAHLPRPGGWRGTPPAARRSSAPFCV